MNSWRYEHGISDYVAEIAGGDFAHGAFCTPVRIRGTPAATATTRRNTRSKMSAAFCFSNRVQLLEYYHNSSWLEHGGSPDHAVKNAFVYQINTYIKDKNLYKKGETNISFQDVQDCLDVSCPPAFPPRQAMRTRPKRPSRTNSWRRP
jgi:DNA gyrase subunit B